jgi:phosphoenolpyruvate carboxylase
MRAAGREEDVKKLYQAWPFFRVTLDMIAMVMAKADATTVELYESKLVRAELQYIGKELRESFHLSRNNLLSVIGNKSVLGTGTQRPSAATPQLQCDCVWV